MGRDAADREGRPGILRMDWTDERVALVVRRWAEGASAGTIAEELGPGVSRSAVLSKIHRLELPQPELKLRREPERERFGRRPRSATKVKRSRRASASALTTAFAALGLGRFHGELDESTAPADARKAFGIPRALLELSAGTCRWPIGDPESADFMFCGAAPVKGRAYCRAHCLIAYRPESAERLPRTRRRRLRTIFVRAAGRAA
jgi:GcrA cell cycle regulator